LKKGKTEMRQQRDMSEEEVQQMLADMDSLIEKTRPSYSSGALNGALYGLAYGFLTSKPSHGNRLKYAAYGAGTVMGLQFLWHAFAKKSGAWMHEHSPYPAPETPIVTKGHFAGMPRMMYHADEAGSVNGYAVGAPGQDYSFTRQPGYNGKNY
jgi:hypothetical protein